MATHFSILPSEIIRYLTLSLNKENNAATENPLRLLRLPHPRTGLLSLFLPCEWLPTSLHDENGIQSTLLEIQTIHPPDERSWFLEEEVISNGNLLMMTPIDPTFILLPILQLKYVNNGNTSQFRAADDLLEESVKQIVDTAVPPKIQCQDLLDFCSLVCTRKSLKNICDIKEISSDIVVYRFSPQKSLDHIRTKVSHLEKCAALDKSKTIVRSLARYGLMEDGKEELLQLGRTRACCDLVAQYLTPLMRETVMASYNFSKLQKYLDANAQDVVATVASSSKSKGGLKETAKEKKDTTAVKRKPVGKASRGIENLKKANTINMPKLTSFFGSKP
ncbi:Ribonuclease H2 subunit B [Psilocybe cubensis]|uniref:Ribonuclease H2 subunit B n=2 Tax=Psilocybe cubensis TaxID=181762 RepID=A0A8H8CN53_PSICU|nr:Ribonuclease H2 subunit B [Psilocybe cubensis]KAH9485164.1 Ribonuclease H2 subunit B [Psilocybe cubensis]